MIKNYFKTTLRYLWRNRLFTGLNIFGLAIGISACWIIYRMVDYEFSFDKQQPNAERVFQVVSQNRDQHGRGGGFSAIAKALPPALADGMTGVELVVPIYQQSRETAHVATAEGGKPRVIESPSGLVATRPDYFKMIPYRWLAGNPAIAIDAPGKVVLTSSRAEDYFPGVPPQELAGKTITYNDTISVTVSGVVADLDYPNSFDAKEFFAITPSEWISDNWSSRSSNEELYIRLHDGVSQSHVLQQINTLNEQHNREGFEKYNYKMWYEFLPLVDKLFAIQYGGRIPTADKNVLYGLMGVAAFLLTLACINYINLSTAQLPQRAREIGIRKTLGSTPARLISHFLGETLVIVLLALGFSFILSSIGLRVFRDFIPQGMSTFANHSGMVAFGLLLAFSITLIAGIYPAWLITRVQTINVLKGQAEKVLGRVRFSLRKGLIVFQFVIAQVFIISAIIIGQQLRYALNKDLGFNHEAVLTVGIPFNIRDKEPYKDKQFVLKQQLERRPEIAGVALGDLPMSNSMMATILFHDSDTGRMQEQVMLKSVDTDFINLYDIPLLAGRNLQTSDTTREYIINEVALKAFGFPTPEAAIGQRLTKGDGDIGLPITGVVKDFHQFSLKSGIDAAALVMYKDGLNTLNIKLPPSQPGKWKDAIALIEADWKRVYPDIPFEYRFYDDTISSLYKQEYKTSTLITAATGITVFISCLGLFGLATLMAFQRTKEIGIRKVLGATVTGIMGLLSKDFVKLILVAVAVASPIAWWAMNRWLEDFAYRIDIQWWMFAVAGLATVVIALFTVSWQAVRAAIANPVDSLRDE
ncbi:MAG TPA: ABC transporter permease [Parapedobacter sp.]|uniref:ABC transporter permease n=1 Tax=Parapedobacter sp. TaxID=1958893 RepID=UPI002C0F5C8C|nr:ABC transporter permease [Parapedobacter sp.]HWK58219.1 ABC transporter permease [Parapedobacter sp.]